MGGGRVGAKEGAELGAEVGAIVGPLLGDPDGAPVAGNSMSPISSPMFPSGRSATMVEYAPLLTAVSVSVTRASAASAVAEEKV